MTRWITLVTIFVATFVVSLWAYIYSFRTELLCLGVCSAFPTEKVVVKGVDVHLSMHEITISTRGLILRSADPEELLLFEAPKIDARLSLPSFILWAILPTTTPLSVASVTMYVRSAMKSAISSETPTIPPLLFRVERLTIIQESKKIVSCVTSQEPYSFKTLIDATSSVSSF